MFARFIPVVRTVLNPLAGAVRTPATTFTLWQIVGGLIWTVGLVLAGYGLGAFIPGVDGYLLPVVAVVVAVSLIPLARELWRERRRRRPTADRNRLPPPGGTTMTSTTAANPVQRPRARGACVAPRRP